MSGGTEGGAAPRGRLFLDANLLFSAASAESAIGRLIAQAERRYELAYSDYVAEEARRNIASKRPAHLAGLDGLLARCLRLQGGLFALPVELAEKDRPVLCAAIRGGCRYLATGDKRDFGHLFGRTVEGVTVLSTVMLKDLLLKDNEA